MSRIAHLSDLHFGTGDQLQPTILKGLVRALDDARADTLFLTGDVFDTSAPDQEHFEQFCQLFDALRSALRGAADIVMLPGNHDRRDEGVFSPWQPALFGRLKERFDDVAHVLGNETPFLSTRLPLEHLPVEVVAYDSTYLPQGLVSAGGVIRQEELIQLAYELQRSTSDRPVLFLVHHHLVPTPVTDTTYISTEGRPAWQRLLVRHVLPGIISSADREELTMTALGAGSALSSLHHIGRPVVVLHGHKHYPIARVLKGVTAEESDVVLTSAGSCGTATDWSGGDVDDAPRLWPSFNLLDVTERSVEVREIAWSPHDAQREATERFLISVERGEARRWNLVAHETRTTPFEAVFATNEGHFALTRSTRFLDRLDLTATRQIEATPRARLTESREVITGLEGAQLLDLRSGDEVVAERDLPLTIAVPVSGRASWSIAGAFAMTLAESERVRGPGFAFECVSFMNRSRCAHAEISLDIGALELVPFASATDLTTGKERPIALTRELNRFTAVVENCPARTMLRVYWPLSRG